MILEILQYLKTVDANSSYIAEEKVRAMVINIATIFNDYADDLNVLKIIFPPSYYKYETQQSQDIEEASEEDKSYNRRELQRTIRIKEGSTGDLSD